MLQLAPHFSIVKLISSAVRVATEMKAF